MGGAFGGDAAIAQALGEDGELFGGTLVTSSVVWPGFRRAGSVKTARRTSSGGSLQFSVGTFASKSARLKECISFRVLKFVWTRSFRNRRRPEAADFRGLRVLEQLLVGGLQILVFAFVLPSEEVLHPNVGEPFAAGNFADSFSKV